jgi:hypothetical protein
VHESTPWAVEQDVSDAEHTHGGQKVAVANPHVSESPQPPHSGQSNKTSMEYHQFHRMQRAWQ